MKHNLKINVSKTPQKDGMVSCKTVSVKERLLKKLFGETRKVMVIVPGDMVDNVTICETPEEARAALTDAKTRPKRPQTLRQTPPQK